MRSGSYSVPHPVAPPSNALRNSANTDIPISSTSTHTHVPDESNVSVQRAAGHQDGSTAADESSAKEFHQYLFSEELTAASFLELFRDLGSAVGADLPDLFLRRWVQSVGALYLRAQATEDRSVKNTGVANITLEQVGWRRGESAERFSYQDTIELRIVSDYVQGKVWDYTKRFDGGPAQTHNIQTERRRGVRGRKRMVHPEEGKAAGDDDGEDDEAVVETEASNRRTALDVAKEFAEPSKLQYVGVDPLFLWIREVRADYPVAMLLQQLRVDRDAMGHIEVIRNMATPPASEYFIPWQRAVIFYSSLNSI